MKQRDAAVIRVCSGTLLLSIASALARWIVDHAKRTHGRYEALVEKVSVDAQGEGNGA